MQQRGSSSNATHEDNKRNVWNQDTPSEVPDEIHEFKTIKVNKLLALSINIELSINCLILHLTV